MCAVKFLRLEDFLDDQRHGMTLSLEPQGILFAEVFTRVQLENLYSWNVVIHSFELKVGQWPCHTLIGFHKIVGQDYNLA